MNILITGGAGFIGSQLALYLQNNFKNFKITILDDFSSGHFKNLKGFNGTLITGKIEDKNLWDYLKSNFKFDIVFHKAAITDTTIMDQEKMVNINTNSFYYIVDAAIHWKAKLIYASSAGVYGNTPSPMREDSGLIPENIYGFSKLLMDNYVLTNDFPISIIGFRYFNVYGFGESFKGKTASMIYQLYKQIKEGKKPRLFKWGEQKRDFVYIKDVIKANILAMEKDKNGIYNVATGKARSFNEIVEILKKLLNVETEIEYFDCPYDFYQNYTEADIKKIQRELGYKPDFTLEDGIRDYLLELGEKV